ncbi:MAG: DUF6493 family protein, partial [Planctomycetia bacterium]|nr:DUF6493 family protein [Planctomycetia bacterium]
NCMVDHWKIEYCQQGTLGEFLEANPDLLENEFWFMFEHEFQEIWQDGSEPGLKSPLNKTFVALTQKGKINRDRFLDAILNVFHFDYSDDALRYFANLYRMLAPTPEEHAARQSRYGDLICGVRPFAAAFGFDSLLELEKSGGLDEALFLDAATNTLNDQAKLRPSKALRLADKIAKRTPELRESVLRFAATALRHSSSDVQTLAIKIIEKHIHKEDESFVEFLVSMSHDLSDFVRKTLSATLGNSLTLPDSEPAKPLSEIGKRRQFGPLDLPRLDTLARLDPVETFDELIDLCLKPDMFENLGDMERMIDGIGRLGHERPEHFAQKVSAIRAQLAKSVVFQSQFEFNSDLFDIVMSSNMIYNQTLVLKSFFVAEKMSVSASGKTLDYDLGLSDKLPLRINRSGFIPLNFPIANGLKTVSAGLGWFARLALPLAPLVWCADRIAHSREKRCGMQLRSFSNLSPWEYLWACLIWECCYRLAIGTNHPLLCPATHDGGWIDPLVLADRIIAAGDRLNEYDTCDKVISLYRLPIDHRAEALARLDAVTSQDPYLTALRLILACDDSSSNKQNDANDSKKTLVTPLPVYYQIAVDADRVIRRDKELFDIDYERTGNFYPDKAHLGEVHTKRFVNQIRTTTSRLAPRKVSSREQTLCPLDFYNQFVPSVRRQYWTLCAGKPLVQWRAWLTPAARTPYYWYQCALLYGEFEWDSLNETSTLALEPLLDPNEPFSLAACIAVLVVMAVKSDAPAASAVDIIIQTINDKRLDGPLFAQAAIWWLRNDLPFRARWLRRFRTNHRAVARSRPNHSLHITGDSPHAPVKRVGRVS